MHLQSGYMTIISNAGIVPVFPVQARFLQQKKQKVEAVDWQTGKSYRISYKAETGHVSVRIIDLIKTYSARDGRVFIRAYCHLRDEERTFRADRVIRAELFAGRHTLFQPITTVVPVPAASPVPVPTQTAPCTTSPISSPRQEKPVYTNFVAEDPCRSQKTPLVHEPGKTLGGFFRNVLSYGFAAVFVLSVLVNSGLLESLATDSSFQPIVRYSSIPTAARPSPAPGPVPAKPSVEDITIGGQLLRTYRSGGIERYEVPSLGITTSNKAEAIAAIRIPLFSNMTGLVHPALIRIYLAADLNTSGKLSFDELAVFQKKTYKEFRYENNEFALRPDEFLEVGGGDCEDYALYTAGLLRFWGWEPYLGSFGPSQSGIGHAVCLSYEEGNLPGNFTYFEVASWAADDGTPLKSGKYIPIDYDKVGSLSTAVEKGWTLRSIYIPEKAWGLRM